MSITPFDAARASTVPVLRKGAHLIPMACLIGRVRTEIIPAAKGFDVPICRSFL